MQGFNCLPSSSCQPEQARLDIKQILENYSKDRGINSSELLENSPSFVCYVSTPYFGKSHTICNNLFLLNDQDKDDDESVIEEITWSDDDDEEDNDLINGDLIGKSEKENSWLDYDEEDNEENHRKNLEKIRNLLSSERDREEKEIEEFTKFTKILNEEKEITSQKEEKMGLWKTYFFKKDCVGFAKVVCMSLMFIIMSLPIIHGFSSDGFLIFADGFRSGLVGRFWNLTKGDALTNNNATLGSLSERYTNCRIFPIDGDKKARAILQWKFISNQTYTNYYPLFNDTQSSKLENSDENPIVRMRLIFGEAPLDLRSNFKVFGFSKSVTSDEGFNTLYKNLKKSSADKNGVQYRYFLDKDISDNRKIKILDFMDQPQSTFHALYTDGNPMFYVAYDNSSTPSTPYLGRSATGTINTTKPYEHIPTCNDDINIGLVPLGFDTYVNVVNSTYTEYNRFCTYHRIKQVAYSGASFITVEKRLNSIVRSKNLPNTQTFSEDNETNSDYKYFIYYMPTTNSGYKNINTTDQTSFLNTYINKDSITSYFLAHEVDFSVDYYDEDCDYYVQLYQTSVYDIYYYIRAVRHAIVGVFSIIVVVFLFIYRKKQPVKSRLHTAMISALISVVFYSVGVVSDIFPVFNYDAIEYAYYLSLAMLYVISLVRYTFVRNLYRVIRIVDKMEDTVISTGEFNDEGLVLNYKRKTMQMKFLSRLASKRIYLSAIISVLVIINLPTPFFLWLVHSGSDTYAIVGSLITYIKLAALIVGFVLPGLLALCFDMFVNRKWLFYDFCQRIFNCGNGNISTYMSKVLSKTRKMEDVSCGFPVYFSDYDDPLCYRLEFLLVTLLSIISGVSTFVVGTIAIPNYRTSLKLTILSVHGILYFLFDLCYVLLTSGFVVIMQLIVERRKWKSRNSVKDQKSTLTGKNPITVLLIKTIGDKTGEGRELIYKFCCKEFSLELLILFERCCKVLELLKAQKYKTDPQTMNKKVCDIYNSFVKTKSSLEVAIPYELKLKISAFMESCTAIDSNSISTDSSTFTQNKKVYAIFKTEQQQQQDQSGILDNRSSELINHQTAVFLSELLDQLKEAALSNLQDTFSRLMATKAYMAYFKKKEMEAQTMKRVGFNREDTIELGTNVIALVETQQQPPTPPQPSKITIDMGGTKIIASINATPIQQEQVNRNYLQTYDNGDEIALTEESTETEDEIIEEDTRHSLDKIDDV